VYVEFYLFFTELCWSVIAGYVFKEAHRISFLSSLSIDYYSSEIL